MVPCGIDGLGRDLKWILSSNSNKWHVITCGPVERFTREKLIFMRMQRFVDAQIKSDLSVSEFGLMS